MSISEQAFATYKKIISMLSDSDLTNSDIIDVTSSVFATSLHACGVSAVGRTIIMEKIEKACAEKQEMEAKKQELKA